MNKRLVAALNKLANKADRAGLQKIADRIDGAVDVLLSTLPISLAAADSKQSDQANDIDDKPLEADSLELHVYDFDGTLFRSPSEPAWWPAGRNWWSWQGSLSSPCVPDKPDGSWWNSEVVASAERSISDGNVFAVLITGRQDAAFRWRVPELCMQAGLNFDEVHLSSGGATAAFKAKVVQDLCKKYHFDLIKIWDDESANYEGIAAAVKIPVKYSQVSADRKQVECDMAEAIAAADHPTKGAAFLQAKLTPESKTKLLSEFPAVHPNVFADHMTIIDKPDVNMIKEYAGKKVTLEVIGHASDERSQAIIVNTDIPVKNAVPHITISTAVGVKPVDSNRMLAAVKPDKTPGITLDCVIDAEPSVLGV